MSDPAPIVRSVSFVRQFAHFGILLLLMVLFVWLKPVSALTGKPPAATYSLEWIAAALLYLLLFILPRRALYKRFGVSPDFAKRGRLEEQLRASTDGADFFARNRWLDRWRWLLFGEAGLYTLRETALLNKAYSLFRLGQEAEAFAVYRQIVEEYPRNGVARRTLELHDKQGQPPATE